MLIENYGLSFFLKYSLLKSRIQLQKQLSSRN